MVCIYGVYLWCVSMVCIYGVYLWCVSMVCIYGVYLCCVSMLCIYAVYRCILPIPQTTNSRQKLMTLSLMSPYSPLAIIDASCTSGSFTLEIYYSNFIARHLYALKYLMYRKISYCPAPLPLPRYRSHEWVYKKKMHITNDVIAEFIALAARLTNG